MTGMRYSNRGQETGLDLRSRHSVFPFDRIVEKIIIFVNPLVYIEPEDSQGGRREEF